MWVLFASLACCWAPIWTVATIAGPAHPYRRSSQLAPPAELLDLLPADFSERLVARLRRVPQLLATRECKPAVSSFQLPGTGSFVKTIGAYFKAQGLARPTLQLLHALLHMDGRFMEPKEPKWAESVQLLRLVAAPGMGKVRECRGELCGRLLGGLAV
jgi:hypothetical protein